MAQQTERDFFEDNLKTSSWLGQVVDIDDPKREGRVRVRVFGKFDELDVEDIPWARPQNRITGGSSSGSGFHSVPKIDSVVGIRFDNGNIYEPEWYAFQHVSDELKEEIEGSYENAHSLIYDTEANPGPVKIFFTEEKGVMIEFNDTQVNLRQDNTVFIRHGSSGKIIHVQQNAISIGKENESDEPAVLGDKNKAALDALANQINNQAIALQAFASAQQAVCASIPYLAPLIPAYATIIPLETNIQVQINGQIKPVLIPQTRSSTITLDGPPKFT